MDAWNPRLVISDSDTISVPPVSIRARTLNSPAFSRLLISGRAGRHTPRHRGNADPITYQGKNGKQYVAVVATDTLVVYALP